MIFSIFSVSGQTCGQTTYIGIVIKLIIAQKCSVFKGFRRFCKFNARNRQFAPERKNRYKKLTDDEYNVLQKISSKTHMDEWFWLEESDDGIDYVRNLDDESHMTLFDGVLELTEGIVSYELCNLSSEEIEAFEGLLTKLQIEADIPRK